jgi:hypothetical protein
MNSASAALKGDKVLARQDGLPVASEASTKQEDGMQTATVERGERTTPPPKGRKKKSAERRERAAKTISGEITEIKASGETYLQVMFEEGHITLSPTSNRSANRDAVVKALRALVKAAS